jgi:hypothetical protein
LVTFELHAAVFTPIGINWHKHLILLKAALYRQNIQRL